MAKTSEQIFKRPDGRKPDQIRPVKIRTGVNRYAEGSCIIEMGYTQVLCLASVEEFVPEWREEMGLGWVTAEYAMIPRATHTRSRRESVKGKLSGRTQEISRLIGRSLRSVVDFKLLGPRTVTLDCEVLQADGGTRCASITGAYVALAQACQRMRRRGLIQGDPLADQVAALSVGVVDKQSLVDLSYEEDSKAQVDMNVIMTGQGKFIELQGTAEGDPFSYAQATKMIRMAQEGMKTLLSIQMKGLQTRR